jgi:prolyl oligopeptidase
MFGHITIALSIVPFVSCWPLARFAPFSILAIIALPAMAIAQAGPTNPMASAQFVAGQAEPGDPYLWLEDVSSAKALEWVKSHNVASIAALESDPRYATLYEEALVIGGAKDRIPDPSFVQGDIYNFWRDAEHLRGIWRKATLADYQTAQPHWTTVLDIDALGKAEGKSFVFRGARCLQRDERHCLISLSEGGEDAIEVREFDLEAGAFVDDGFRLPRGKQNFGWEDADHILVGREWAPGDLTPSGYPYVVKRLGRGQRLAAATEVFRGDKSNDVSAVPNIFHDGKGHRLALIVRRLDFFRHETYILAPQGAQRLDIPAKADVAALVDGRVIVHLRESWTVADQSFPAGALVQLDLAAVEAEPARLQPRPVWSPGPRESLRQVRSTRNKLLLSTLDNVRGRAWIYSPTDDGGWTHARLDLPDNMAIGYGATDNRSNLAFLNISGFLTPGSLWFMDASSGSLQLIKALPAKFDSSGEVVEQLEATSSDGVKIPYFIVHPADIKYDGQAPTLISAYGGFEASLTPSYSATTGKLWLERGGIFVLANIRGGGEFGPAWHEAGLATRRQIIYDDFAAVARDLIGRKITSPRRLGIEGESNGGLLMGVEFTQHPELWNAVVISVPLLDMIRISKIAAGASWQGEYGDVNNDPAVTAFWLKTSPYQNLKAGVAYPEPFIFTTTKDDRVGPQHARKFAARLEEMKLPFFYYENTEGGHGTGADLQQSAHTTALTMTYLQRKLMD